MDSTLATLSKRSVLTSADELVEFIQSAAIDPFEGDERRSVPRYPLALPVQARPVDHAGKLAGSPVAGVTRDVSLAGMSVLLVSPSGAEYLLLEMTGTGRQPVHAVLEVLRERPLGPFWEVAGQFLFDPE
jgi:hypothetical protein